MGEARVQLGHLSGIDRDLRAVSLLQHQLVLDEVPNELDELRIGRLFDLIEDAGLRR